MRTTARPTGGKRRAWARRGLIVAALLAPGFVGTRPAHAQFGFGFGFGGMMGGGGYSNMATLNYINSRSEAAASAAYSERARGPFGTGSGNPYQGNANAYVNRVHDDQFFERYNASSRRSIESHVARRPDPSLLNDIPPPTGPKEPTPPPAQARAPRTVPAFDTFFTPNGVLVWPSNSPAEGELGSKQKDAGQAAAMVFAQVRSQGYAPVGIVTDARTKLVTYGQPALLYLRQKTTPAIADGFHTFLLGLYDSLGQAATPGTRPSAPAPPANR